jgi:hypothetical protein
MSAIPYRLSLMTVFRKLQPSSEKHDDQSAESCIANISPAERRKRLAAGIIQLAIAAAILAFLIITQADRLLRLPLFLVFTSAGISYFQWRDKT